MTSDSDSIKDIDSLDIYKKALDDLGAFLEPSELVQSDIQNAQNQSEVSDECSGQSRLIPKSSNDKKLKISESEEIFNRLLVIFTARDRVQKSLLSNVLENSSTVEIEVHQLDRQLRNNLKTINCKIKPKIKIDIMSSLAEFKAQRTVSSNDWWWNYQLTLGWRYSRCWSFWACVCLGFSAVILYKIIYGLTTGQILIQANSIYSGATVFFTAIGTILGFVGLKDLFSGQIKDFALSRWKDVNQSSLFKVKSFKSPYTSFRWSFSSLIVFLSVSIILPYIFNNFAVSKSWSQGRTFKEVKNDLERAAYLDPDNVNIRRNLARFYLYDHDYDNAAKSYKTMLPDFEATVELIHLHLLKLDNIDNYKNKEFHYDEYTDYLTYILNASYFNNFCRKQEDNLQKTIYTNFFGNNQGNEWLKKLATKTANNFKGCTLEIYEYTEQDTSKDGYLLLADKDAYLKFLRYTFQLLKMRGLVNLSKKQYSQAKLNLDSAWNLANETSLLLRDHSEKIKNNIKDTPNREKYLEVFKGVLDDTDIMLAAWEQRKSESACLLRQLFTKIRTTKEDQLLYNKYKKECYSYIPRYLEEWLKWVYEYYRSYNWSESDLTEKPKSLTK
jgi:hypothetical protein